MEKTLLNSLWLFLQPHLPALSGTTLHLLIVKKKSEENVKIKPIGFVGWITLAAISLLVGFLFMWLTEGWYAYREKPIKTEVVTALRVVGSTLGFAGLMWITNKVQTSWDTFFKAQFGKRKDRYESSNNYDRYDRNDYSESDHSENNDSDYHP